MQFNYNQERFSTPTFNYNFVENKFSSNLKTIFDIFINQLKFETFPFTVKTAFNSIYCKKN